MSSSLNPIEATGNIEGRASNRNRNNNSRRSTFRGDCKALRLYGTNIYDWHPASCHIDQYDTTTEEISIYVGCNFDSGSHICVGITKLQLPVIEAPSEPDDTASRTAIKMWEYHVKTHAEQIIQMEENNRCFYDLVWGQCTKTMKRKVKMYETHETIANSRNGIGLLALIRDASYEFQSKRYPVEVVVEALVNVVCYRQGPHLSTSDYYVGFMKRMKNYLRWGGSNDPNPGSLKEVAKLKGWDMNNITVEQKQEVKNLEWAIMFVQGADLTRYGNFKTQLHNSYMCNGHNVYPKTVSAAYDRLRLWKEI